KQRNVPIRDLLGPTVNAIVPGYLSGLPAATLAQRVALAADNYSAGPRAFKFGAAVSHEGIVAEMSALRRALGPDAQIMVDLHWKFTAGQALPLIAALAPSRPPFFEP